MKWGEVQPGWSFLYNREVFLLIAIYPTIYPNSWSNLDIIYLITDENGHVRFWNDTRRAENNVYITPESKVLP